MFVPLIAPSTPSIENAVMSFAVSAGLGRPPDGWMLSPQPATTSQAIATTRRNDDASDLMDMRTPPRAPLSSRSSKVTRNPPALQRTLSHLLRTLSSPLQRLARRREVQPPARAEDDERRNVAPDRHRDDAFSVGKVERRRRAVRAPDLHVVAVLDRRDDAVARQICEVAALDWRVAAGRCAAHEPSVHGRQDGVTAARELAARADQNITVRRAIEPHELFPVGHPQDRRGAGGAGRFDVDAGRRRDRAVT